MEYTSQPAEAAYSFDQAVDLADSENDDYYANWEPFDDETDHWPRYEPEANNFGDF